MFSRRCIRYSNFFLFKSRHLLICLIYVIVFFLDNLAIFLNTKNNSSFSVRIPGALSSNLMFILKFRWRRCFEVNISLQSILYSSSVFLAGYRFFFIFWWLLQFFVYFFSPWFISWLAGVGLHIIFIEKIYNI